MEEYQDKNKEKPKKRIALHVKDIRSIKKDVTNMHSTTLL